MELFDLEDMRGRRRKQVIRLMEVSDLTRQILEAADRRDQVSVRMLLSMRQEPVQQLQELEQGIRDRLPELPEEDAIRLHELLEGAEPVEEQEKPLCEQVAQYRRLLKTALELDRRLSIKLGGHRSVYRMFREEHPASST